MKSIIDLASVALCSGLIWLIRRLPPKLGLGLCRLLFDVALLLVPRLKRAGTVNLRLAFPEKSTEEHRRIFSQSIGLLAKNLYSYATLPSLTPVNAQVILPYETAKKDLEELRKSSPHGSILFATAHYGLFELMVQVHALTYRPLSILARGFGLPRLDALWNKRRMMFGNQVFWRKGGYRQAVQRLKNGEDVTMLCDQNVKMNHAVFVDFFGLKAATSKGVALAALETKSPVVFGTSFEVSPGKYKLWYRVLPPPETVAETFREQVEKFTELLNQVIEEAIREHPDHWFWVHRRWKTRPPGELENLYDECEL